LIRKVQYAPTRVVGASCGNFHFDRDAADIGELHRVAHEIEQYLTKTLLVRPYPERYVRRGGHTKLQPLARSGLGEDRPNIGHA
jgi:hypothetical protein